ncbi:hypothetical protein [Senegalia massiliensis]|uniref:DUF3887 domain-containing protein n=1 Tax=Senegalia massiliensis TaxID=1720316 RepID=A0A845R2W3_9CLOT|nr:hypothetical protein [Senegalia massiliensis]NBI07772.1 hypothetical protein [Senegalia massiliensis]
MRNNRIIMIIIIALMFSSLIGCNNENEEINDNVKTPEETISSWADDIVENFLISIDKKDYESFSKDFSENMKEQLNESMFKEQVLLISELIGDYIKGSKELLTTEEVDENNIKLIYSSDYSNEKNEVIVTTVFNKESQLIEGLFINSEKIQNMQ